MKTQISLVNSNSRALPSEFAGDDVRYTDDLVAEFLNQFTKEGDVVFDPFMGFGTTLIVAEKLNRIGYGVEFDAKRVDYVHTLLQHPERALHGDSTKLVDLLLPPVDFSITSPPYMGKHHKENPFTSYTTIGEGYSQYLETLQGTYRQLKQRLKPAAHAVIEVSNLKHEDGTITLLAWDIARVVSEVLTFEGEVIVNWENGYGFGYDHSYCLVFANR